MVHHRPVLPLAYGVPQGLVLGPQKFSIYATPVDKIFSKNNLISNLNAKDTQIYLPVKPLQMDVATAVDGIDGRVAENRMSSNVLKLNDDKTEVIIFCSAKPLKKKKKKQAAAQNRATRSTHRR